MNIFLRIFRDIATNKDDSHFCHSKTLSLIAFIVLLGLSIYCVIRGDKFDMINWSGGVGAIILSGAGGARIKMDTELQ